jgi:hypothetical protein
VGKPLHPKKELIRNMENFELIQKLQPFLGQKTTFKKIANKIGISSEILADKIIQLETEGKLKFLALGNGIIRIGEIEGGEINKLTIEYAKSELFFNSYTNKKGIKKISINLSEDLSIKLSNNNQDVIGAIVDGIKKEI